MSNYPPLDVEKIVRAKTIESVLFDPTKDTKHQPIEFYNYVLWKYAQPKCTRLYLVDSLCIPMGKLGGILRHYKPNPDKTNPGYLKRVNNPYRDPEFEASCKNLYTSGITNFSEIARLQNCHANAVIEIARRNKWPQKSKIDIPIHRDSKFVLKCKELYDAGFTFSEIANKVGTSPTKISCLAEYNNWKTEIHDDARFRPIEWQMIKELPVCSVTSYRRYVHLIRHYTSKIYETYQYLLNPHKLNRKDWHIDHKLSVYNAYNQYKRPLPWQMIIHPANLVLKYAESNSHKGRNSDISVKQLLTQIKEFESEHRPVRLPAFIDNTKGGKYKYTDSGSTVAQRIASESYISIKDLKRLYRKDAKYLLYVKRQHLVRGHYEYIVCQLLKGKSQSDIAFKLGCSENFIKTSLVRMRLPSHMEMIRLCNNGIVKRILKLASKGYKISQVSEKFDLDPITILYLYLRYKE